MFKFIQLRGRVKFYKIDRDIFLLRRYDDNSDGSVNKARSLNDAA